VCKVVQQQFTDLSAEYSPEIKFVLLNIDGAEESGDAKPVGDTFPLLDEMLLETPAFSIYYQQDCVEKFCGADMDRLVRQLDRLRAMYKHAAARTIAKDIVRDIINVKWPAAMELVNSLRGTYVDPDHVAEVIFVVPVHPS